MCLLFRRGSKRQVSVFKYEMEGNKNEKDGVPFFALSSDSKEVIHEVLARYPPGDGVTNEEVHLDCKGKKGRKKKIRDDMFLKPSMNRVEIARKVDLISHRMQEDTDLRKVLHFPLYISKMFSLLIYLSFLSL